MRTLASLVSVVLLFAGSGAAASVLSEDFNSDIPGTWSVTDNAGTGLVWSNLAGCGEGGNCTGGTGDAACASSDVFGTSAFDTELRTPGIDLSVYSSAELSYLVNYQNFAQNDFLDVDISTDGGTGWTNLLSWNEDHGTFSGTPGEAVTIDLSGYLQPNVMVRWRYYDPAQNWDWYVQIDNVSIVTIPEPGTISLLALGLLGVGLWKRRAKPTA